MNSRSLLRAAGAFVLAGSLVLAQKQPKPKSQKETDAVMAIFNAQTPDARIEAAENLLTKFADTEFKAVALQVAAASAQQKNDYEKMVIYCERTLEADPQNYSAMLMLANGIAQKTREFDLDKEEKLARSEKYAKSALDLIKVAPKPRPDITDAQWDEAKKDYTSQAHEALGLSAMVRKKYDVAASEFKIAVEGGASPDQATMVRLASAYNLNGKPDDAIAVLDKLMAMPDLNPQIKQVAEREKMTATKLKSGAAKPPSAPAPPPQVEIKKLPLSRCPRICMFLRRA
jgi:tetratricopeptide (TPR) repeat protein